MTVVAVDGGGTKTDVVVVELDGRVRARAVGGAHLPQLDGPVPAIDAIGSLVRAVLSDADAVAAVASVFVSGADLPEEEEAIRAAVAEAGWAPAHVVGNDMFALLRAGTSAPDAIAVGCGTGINAVGVAADGSVVRYPALGRLSGDWGGGLDLAEAMIWHAARAEDGRGPRTGLEDVVCTAFGLSSVSEVVRALHLGTTAKVAASVLPPLLFDVAAAGDEVAAAIVARQADEICALAIATARRLGFAGSGPRVPLVLGGSVLAAQHPLLIAPIVARLARETPRLEPAFVTTPPVVGAALIGIAHAGVVVTPAIRARLEGTLVPATRAAVRDQAATGTEA